MSAGIEQRVLFFGIADLAKVHLLVSYFPVTDALAVAFTVTVAANIFVASLVFDPRPLSVWLVFEPVTGVRVTRAVLDHTCTLATALDEVTGIGVTGFGDMSSVAVVVTFAEVTGVVFTI